jgi:hypothetical protein
MMAETEKEGNRGGGKHGVQLSQCSQDGRRGHEPPLKPLSSSHCQVTRTLLLLNRTKEMSPTQSQSNQVKSYLQPVTLRNGQLPCPIYLFVYLVRRIVDLNSGLPTCKAGALKLEPHLQTFLLQLFW